MSHPLFSNLSRAIALVLLAVTQVHGTPYDQLIKKGDAFGLKLQPAEALKFYLPAEEMQPKSVPLLVRIAREYRHLMADAAGSKEKLRLGGIALDYARRAAALAPGDSDAQLSPAISYGKLLPLYGTKERLAASSQIKNFAERAIQLDPRNDLAWHVLGKWHRVLADVGGVKRALGSLIYGKLPTTTNEEAVKCFERAIKLNSNRVIHHIELGRAYAQMGRATDARRSLEQGLAMPNVEKDDVEAKQRGREALAKLN